MRWLGRTDVRVITAVVVTALLPLVASAWLGQALIGRISATAFQPEFGEHLDRALSVYADLAKAMKDGLRQEAGVIASARALDEPQAWAGPEAMTKALDALGRAHPRVAKIEVGHCDEAPVGSFTRAEPVDPSRERTFTVQAAIGGAGRAPEPGEDPCATEGAHVATITFAIPRGSLDDVEEAATFKRTYDEIAVRARADYVDAPYKKLFFAIFGVTVLLGVAIGLLVARPVTAGISRLVAATRTVARGDLSVRVDVRGANETAELGRAFNRMLQDLAEHRGRIEFLQKVEGWQKVARRLAHEIKNPLTPIQLAVEECHRRYNGVWGAGAEGDRSTKGAHADDGAFRRVLDTTVEVVTEEVASLRRLVGEFTAFARLPRPSLADGDLATWLADERDHASILLSSGAPETSGDAQSGSGAEPIEKLSLTIDVPDAPMPAAFDREMLHRALANLVRNAMEALRDHPSSPDRWGAIRVKAARIGEDHVIDVEDDGPGIPDEVRAALFEPYVTTKRDGTGLGMAIVKKIIVDHGGAIEVTASDRGTKERPGTRVRLRLPRVASI